MTIYFQILHKLKNYYLKKVNNFLMKKVKIIRNKYEKFRNNLKNKKKMQLMIFNNKLILKKKLNQKWKVFEIKINKIFKKIMKIMKYHRLKKKSLKQFKKNPQNKIMKITQNYFQTKKWIIYFHLGNKKV